MCRERLRAQVQGHQVRRSACQIPVPQPRLRPRPRHRRARRRVHKPGPFPAFLRSCFRLLCGSLRVRGSTLISSHPRDAKHVRRAYARGERIGAVSCGLRCCSRRLLRVRRGPVQMLAERHGLLGERPEGRLLVRVRRTKWYFECACYWGWVGSNATD